MNRTVLVLRRAGARAAISLLLILLFLHPLRASLNGSISGEVTDPHNLAIAGAKVTAINTATGIRLSVTNDGGGIYSFPDLPVGTYDIQVECQGFRTYRRTQLVLDANSALREDVSLLLGKRSETVTVTARGTRVETVDTQLGEVISGTKMTSVPLNGAVSPTCWLYSRASLQSLPSPAIPSRRRARLFCLLRVT